MAVIYPEEKSLVPVLNCYKRDIEEKYGKSMIKLSLPKDVDHNRIGEVAILLDPTCDNVKPHFTLSWLSKYKTLTTPDIVEQFRRENAHKLSEKLKQISLLKAIELRKSKKDTGTTIKPGLNLTGSCPCTICCDHASTLSSGTSHYNTNC